MNLILYSRPECGLCDEAMGLLSELDQAATEVDVESSDQLMATYGLRIPVLADGTGRELDWPFDEDQLRSYLGCT